MQKQSKKVEDWPCLCEDNELCASTWGDGTEICDSYFDLECEHIEVQLGHDWVRLVIFVPALGEMAQGSRCCESAPFVMQFDLRDCIRIQINYSTMKWCG